MKERKPLDAKDHAILGHLQEDGSLTTTELARRVDLSPPGLQKRIRKLEDAEVIHNRVTLLNREAIGLDLLCFVQVTLAHHQPDAVADFRASVRKLSRVLECHHLTGQHDYLLKVVAENHRELEKFLVEELTSIPSVDRIRTSIALREIKNTTALPLPHEP